MTGSLGTSAHHFLSIEIYHVQAHQIPVTVVPVVGPRIGPVFQTDAGHAILNSSSASTIQS